MIFLEYVKHVKMDLFLTNKINVYVLLDNTIIRGNVFNVQLNAKTVLILLVFVFLVLIPHSNLFNQQVSVLVEVVKYLF